MNLLFWTATIGTLGIIGYIQVYYNLVKIRDSWSEYRCNPLYMIFAGWVDPDIGTEGNFQRCMNLYGKDLVTSMTDLFGAQISLVIEALTEILNPLKMFRTLFATIRKFILSFTNTTLQKASGPLSSFSFLMIKIQDLLRKMSASGYISSLFGLTFVSFIEGFVSLFISIVKGFIIAMLIIATILALFNFPLLALVLYIASQLQGI
jgi:hypothetical protein